MQLIFLNHKKSFFRWGRQILQGCDLKAVILQVLQDGGFDLLWLRQLIFCTRRGVPLNF